METAIVYSTKKFSAKELFQSLWQRITLLSILGYEGLGVIVGGLFFKVAPDGYLMQISA
jgi:hypothetical protein